MEEKWPSIHWLKKKDHDDDDLRVVAEGNLKMSPQYHVVSEDSHCICSCISTGGLSSMMGVMILLYFTIRLIPTAPITCRPGVCSKENAKGLPWWYSG